MGVEVGQSRAPVLRLHHDELIVDNFAGGGGASLGMEWALGRSPDIAINHDAQAVAMHAANHPTTRHYVEDVWKVDPKKACGGKPVGLAWFSPDCKHFSKAKGGKPVSKKIRGLAWIVVKWAKAVKPRVICLENVEEFQDWGPLGDDDRPDKLRRGHTFQRWKAQLENLGYQVEWRELVAADYGAPTTRKRLFLVARCDGKPIRWPAKTHDQHGRYGLPKWRAAAECIDWSLPCHSIFLTPEEAKPFGIRRPLADNTMRRIYRGLMKFVINNPQPFIVGLAHGEFKDGSGGARSRSIDEPLTTIHAGGKNYAVVAPHIAKFRGDSAGTAADEPLHTITAGPAENPAGAAHAMALVSAGIVPLTHQGAERNESTDDPMRTITGAHRGEKALATAYVTRIGQTGGGDQSRSVEAPVSTVTSKAEHLLVAPILTGAGGPEYSGKPTAADKPVGTLLPENHRGIAVATLVTTGYGEREGQKPRTQDIEKPLGTVVAAGKHAAVMAFLAQHNGGFYDANGGAGRSVEQPLSTIAGKGCTQQVVQASFGVKLKGTCKDGQQLSLPLHTVQAEGNHHAAVEAFMVAYYGNENDGQQMIEPLRTVTARDRLGLVMVHGEPYVITDIGMRMLVPRELYTAQGFPTGYRIDITYKGKPLPKDAQVRMCGNSVSPYPCAELVRANFIDLEEAVAA